MAEILSARELAEEGHAAYQRGDFLAAGKAYQAAAQSYQESGDVVMAAEMRNNSSVAYLRAGDGATALEMVEGTPEVFAVAGDARRQGMALGNRGAALEAVKRYDEAAEMYRHSAELLGLVGEDQLRAEVMKSLSILQMRTGHQLEAVATMQAGLEGIKKPTAKQSLVSRLLRFPSKFMKP